MAEIHINRSDFLGFRPHVLCLLFLVLIVLKYLLDILHVVFEGGDELEGVSPDNGRFLDGLAIGLEDSSADSNFGGIEETIFMEISDNFHVVAACFIGVDLHEGNYFLQVELRYTDFFPAFTGEVSTIEGK